GGVEGGVGRGVTGEPANVRSHISLKEIDQTGDAQRSAHRPLLSLAPRKIPVGDMGEMRPQLRHMPLQHGPQTVVLHPCEPRRRIDLRREIGGEEAVALEPPRSHQDEDAKSRVGKAGAHWWRVAMHSDSEIQRVLCYY